MNNNHHAQQEQVACITHTHDPHMQHGTSGVHMGGCDHALQRYGTTTSTHHLLTSPVSEYYLLRDRRPARENAGEPDLWVDLWASDLGRPGVGMLLWVKLVG